MAAVQQPKPERETPATKFSQIFTSEMPAHEKILQFTKQYCIPSLIDNKELIQFGKDKSSMDQIESSRELIPYICFFNGLGVL